MQIENIVTKNAKTTWRIIIYHSITYKNCVLPFDGTQFSQYADSQRVECQLNFGSTVDAVEGRGYDTSGITRTLTTRVETWHLRVLECLGVARDTYWR